MKVSIPLTQVLRASSTGPHHLLSRDFQRPLTPPNGVSSHSVPISTGFQGMVHTITISVGSPPQPFHAMLDFGSSDLLIPSTQGSERHRYKSHLSKTHHRNGTAIQSSQFGEIYQGFSSQDTLSLPDINIPNMLFEEAPTMNHRDVGSQPSDLEFDTIFPLAPYNSSYEHNFMSPLAHLIENNLLDHNIFSLCLPQNQNDDDGWLLLGAFPPLYIWHEENIKSIPVSDLPIPHPLPYPLAPYYAQGEIWKFQIDSFSFGNTSIHKTYTTPTIAIVDVLDSWIGLSWSLVKSIHELIGANGWGPFQYVDCRNRHLMPNVTIVLAGQEFEFTAFEYTVEQWDDEPFKGKMYCMSVFMGLDDEDRDEGNVVILGSAFLKGFVTVWDLVGRKMSYVKADR